jgi:hypothetical protein
MKEECILSSIVENCTTAYILPESITEIYVPMKYEAECITAYSLPRTLAEKFILSSSITLNC